MVEQRRPSARTGGPRGRTGPGRGGNARSGRPLGPGGDTGTQARVPPVRAPRTRRPRPRITGRMAVLVLVLAVLTVSFASSLKAYLQQRHDIDALKVEIAQRQASISRLEAQKRRWKDPAYLAQQARIDFGYVMPGQTSFVALGPNGKPIAPAGTLTKASSVGVAPEPKAWWSTVWNSVELAGDPQQVKVKRAPATKITPSQTHQHKHS